MKAVDFLTDATKSVIENGTEATGRVKGQVNVVVLGGGDTGNDCIGTAIRQGCAGITQLEINPELPKERTLDNQWPEWPMVLKDGYGQLEAQRLFGEITTYTATATGFFGENGQLSEVEVSRTDHYKPIAGSQKRIKADLVLLAMGFTGAEQWLFDAFGITKVNANYSTNDSQVFVAGDSHRGQSLVIWASYEGRMCAEKINASFEVLSAKV